uniref:Putative secreted protein n=1 Tax=Ixodes ricinus TaxID=34613 RepID=A0A6B0U3M7_IXORI
MLPKMMPFSVDATLTVALMLQKSWGASTTGVGFSTSFRSPRVASSSVQFWRVSAVWFTTSTSRAMSYWFTCT